MEDDGHHECDDDEVVVIHLAAGDWQPKRKGGVLG